MDVLFKSFSLLPFEWAQYSFMTHALVAILLMTPLFAILGCLVIGSRMAFFADAIGHATLTGIAVGALAGFADPLWVMIAFALVLAVTISSLKRITPHSTDTIIALTMSSSVALGVVLLSHAGGISRYSKYLVGDILSITPEEIVRLAVLLGVTGVVWLIYFNRILLLSFNSCLAKSRAINTWFTETLFACLVAVVVSSSISWVGLLVISSLLIFPAAISRNVARNAFQYVVLAISVSFFTGIVGLIGSYYLDTATGATIVLVATGLFILSLFFQRA